MILTPALTSCSARPCAAALGTARTPTTMSSSSTIFADHGFQVVAVFDSDPTVVGKQIGELQVRDLGEVQSVVEAEEIVVGVLAVPAEAAQEVADRLVKAGVKIIFNYSEQLLQVPPEVTVHTSSPAVDLLYALYFYLA